MVDSGPGKDETVDVAGAVIDRGLVDTSMDSLAESAVLAVNSSSVVVPRARSPEELLGDSARSARAHCRVPSATVQEQIV